EVYLHRDADSHAGFDVEQNRPAGGAFHHDLDADACLERDVDAGLDDHEINRAVNLADETELALERESIGLLQDVVRAVGQVAGSALDDAEEGDADAGLE